MAIEQLVRVLPCPNTKYMIDIERWRNLEADLGIRFPLDYQQFCECYGPGEIVDRGRLRLQIFNPMEPMYRHQVEKSCYVLRSLKQSQWGADICYEVFPVIPGLFPFGHDDNGNRLFWFTEGSGDTWPIVIYEHDGPGGMDDFQVFDMSLTTFLGKVVKGDIECKVWAEAFFDDPTNVEFIRTGAS